MHGCSERAGGSPQTGDTAGARRKTCLLMMPTTLFHYPPELCRALESMGYSVTLANDEYPSNPLGKAMGKLDWSLSRWWTRRTVNRRFLNGRNWDLVLIFKGRGVGPELIEDLRKHARRIVGYHYDALNYDRSMKRWSNLVDRISTFDPRDAREQGWDLVRLFAACKPPSEPRPKRYLLSAVLRNHSNRLAYIDRITEAVPGAETFIYFFEKDVLTMLINLLRNPRAYWKWRKHIHFKALPYDTFVEVLTVSEFTIDYAHPRQQGSTMRCSEAQALGAKLITNNPHLDQPGTQLGDHVILCPDDFSQSELRARVEAMTGQYPPNVERTLVTFLGEVLGTEQEPAMGEDFRLAKPA